MDVTRTPAPSFPSRSCCGNSNPNAPPMVLEFPTGDENCLCSTATPLQRPSRPLEQLSTAQRVWGVFCCVFCLPCATKSACDASSNRSNTFSPFEEAKIRECFARFAQGSTASYAQKLVALEHLIRKFDKVEFVSDQRSCFSHLFNSFCPQTLPEEDATTFRMRCLSIIQQILHTLPQDVKVHLASKRADRTMPCASLSSTQNIARIFDTYINCTVASVRFQIEAFVQKHTSKRSSVAIQADMRHILVTSLSASAFDQYESDEDLGRDFQRAWSLLTPEQQHSVRNQQRVPMKPVLAEIISNNTVGNT